jgi:hypothetical protein
MELQFSPTACFTWSYFCIGKDQGPFTKRFLESFFPAKNVVWIMFKPEEIFVARVTGEIFAFALKVCALSQPETL